MPGSAYIYSNFRYLQMCASSRTGAKVEARSASDVARTVDRAKYALHLAVGTESNRQIVKDHAVAVFDRLDAEYRSDRFHDLVPVKQVGKPGDENEQAVLVSMVAVQGIEPLLTFFGTGQWMGS